MYFFQSRELRRSTPGGGTGSPGQAPHQKPKENTGTAGSHTDHCATDQCGEDAPGQEVGEAEAPKHNSSLSHLLWTQTLRTPHRALIRKPVSVSSARCVACKLLWCTFFSRVAGKPTVHSRGRNRAPGQAPHQKPQPSGPPPAPDIEVLLKENTQKQVQTSPGSKCPRTLAHACHRPSTSR